MFMQRRRYKVPTNEHTRYYGRQGDRDPQFILFKFEIENDNYTNEENE